MLEDHLDQCCVIHGCHFNKSNCPVVSREYNQIAPCLDCDYENIGDPCDQIHMLHLGKYYHDLNSNNKLSIVGRARDNKGKDHLVIEVDGQFLTVVDYVRDIKDIIEITQSEYFTNI